MFGDMTGVDKVFLACAGFGGVLFMVRLVLMIMGAHTDADVHADGDIGDMGDIGDVHVDAGHVDVDAHADIDADGDVHGSDASFRLLTLQGITAFFMMFGLVGLAMRKGSAQSEGLAMLAAVGGGGVALWIMAKITQMVMGLQSSGTLNLRNAIGQEGRVYLTIAEGQTGKVQVAVQGRLVELNAVGFDGKGFKTGETVWVTGIQSGNILVVDKTE